jgi:endonuclease YncB( thermonuclease family)
MRWCNAACIVVSSCLTLGLSLAWARPQANPPGQQAEVKALVKPEQKPQTRPHGSPILVEPALITVDDGDTVTIRWGEKDEEIVRILGIDTPETRHDEHGIPLDQAFGPEARTFAQGAFAVATDVSLIRADKLDPYDRTLGYLILNGKNYSVLVINARLAEESVSHYGDNGLPVLAAEVMSAAKLAGPLPFESPHAYRRRMRALSDWMRG